ncbi:MAG: hypothetical protein PHY43_11290 [Verrucomicrobiales bacterium]|nr:hypothetical protein [Verrucomicrobiales bacterium]
MNRPASLIVSGIFCLALLAGCGKPAGGSAPASTVAPDVANASASQPDGPKAGEKICFACNGSGAIKCLAPGCVDGKVDCPGPCLKLDRGVWIHMDVAGHPPTDLWQKFNQGNGSYTAYNQGHVGHVIAMQNGKAMDTGPCKICGGTGKVVCSVCKGTGLEACLICGGKKYIPDSWTPANNPWLNGQPDLIRLTDGRILLGKVISTVGTDLTIKTRDGKWMHVNASDVVPKPATGSTNTVAP